jgi:CheY-like chemotaxis protein
LYGRFRAFERRYFNASLTLLTAWLTLDLVVTDLRMPRMDGRQLSAELSAKYPHIRVLFLSGHDAYLGPIDPLGPVIPKPFRAEILIETVQGVLAQQQRSA